MTCSLFKYKYNQSFSNIKAEYKKYTKTNESLEFANFQKILKINITVRLKLEKLEIKALM